MNSVRLAILTAPGQAALATLALAGPGAWELACRLFTAHSGKLLPDQPPPGKTWLGRFGLVGEALADEVVLAVPTADRAEIHAHGGREVLRFLTEVLVAHGATLCPWQELVAATDADPIRSAALVALPSAPTLRTASILLDQYGGALSNELRRIRALLVHTRGEGLQALEQLRKAGRIGAHLTTPFRVVVAGAPNAGKSSLINALAGYERSIVSPLPGTTRDVVTVGLALDGWPIELCDTAGLRSTTDPLESAGVGLAREVIAEADLVLWLLDASTAPVWPDTPGDRLHLVVNKVDQPPAWDLSLAKESPHISALTGQGLDHLCSAILHWLLGEGLPEGAAVPFTPDQLAHLEELEKEFRE